MPLRQIKQPILALVQGTDIVYDGEDEQSSKNKSLNYLKIIKAIAINPSIVKILLVLPKKPRKDRGLMAEAKEFCTNTFLPKAVFWRTAFLFFDNDAVRKRGFIILTLSFH